MQTTVLIFSIFIAVLASAAFFVRPITGRFDRKCAFFRQRYGDWAIVAGASEGMGAAWARALCSYGINVLLVARREDAMKALANELESAYEGIKVETLVRDLSDPNLEAAFSEVLHENRNYGFLVFNAAHVKIGPFVSNPLEKEHKTIDLNIRGVLTLTHAFANHLKAQKKTGGIILMSSLAGELGSAYIANYAASKAWNTAFARGLRHELAPLGIDVLACVAGATTTPNYVNSMDKANRNTAIEQSPDDVVEECTQAIGAYSSVVTGRLNKFSRAFLVRFLPLEMSLGIFNRASEKMVLFDYP